MSNPAPDHIDRLREGEVFVFGSNLAGRHGKGAALFARLRFGAVRGVGSGPTGRCYAIPTKDHCLRVLPLQEIGRHVATFLEYAAAHPASTFLVTAVGCGEAGYSPGVIAPLFLARDVPSNVHLPASFLEVRSSKPL